MANKWEYQKRQIKESGACLYSKQARRFLLEARGPACEICGLEHWTGSPIPLVCDHIDGNSSNWLLSNLRMICCNCDAQTPTYKAKNVGNGRHYRRERYANGKSY